MKKIRSLFLASLAIAFHFLFAFNTFNNYNSKPFAVSTYYYTGICQRIQPGICNHEKPAENSLSCAELTKKVNWSNTGTAYSSLGNYLAAISFDEESQEDGGDDGQLTLSEALLAICKFYSSETPNDLPSYGGSITVGKAAIKVHRKAAV
jgi:hypothetical protein